MRDCELLEDGGPTVPMEKMPRHRVPTIPVESRECNFREVDQTFSDDVARYEADRCMRCYRMMAVATPRPIPGNEALHRSPDTENLTASARGTN